MNFIRSFRKIQKMEGRFLAVSASVIIWIISYIISLRYFSHKFTNEVKILDSKEKADIKMLTYAIVGIPFLSPMLASTAFRIGGILEKGRGIAWGCYIEDFSLITIFLWLGSVILLFIMLIIDLLQPAPGPHSRKKAVGLYLIHHLYTLILFYLMLFLIPILSGPLSGKGSSCLWVDNPVAIVPVIHDLVIIVKKTLTMVGLRINTMEIRQIIRLKKERNSNRKVAGLLNLSRNTVWNSGFSGSPL